VAGKSCHASDQLLLLKRPALKFVGYCWGVLLEWSFTFTLCGVLACLIGDVKYDKLA
jgi:hypothetical protein